MIIQRIGECSNPSVQTPLRDGFIARAFSWHGRFHGTGIEEARALKKHGARRKNPLPPLRMQRNPREPAGVFLELRSANKVSLREGG